MSKYLIINLKRNGDVLFCAHLISSIKAKNPNSEIHLLIYREFIKAAQCLGDVKQIHTIDREHISLLKKNKIFPKSHALDLFWNNLQSIKNIKWDNVINFSNEPIAANIVSFLGPQSYSGVRIGPKATIQASNNWASFFNEVITQYIHTPFHLMECYHNMAGISWQEERSAKIKTNVEHDELAKKNIQQLKEKNASNGQKPLIVGIQLFTSSIKKNVPIETLKELLGLILKSSNYFPLLLISPNSKEKEIVNELNEYFSNKLVTAESDFIALSSLVKQLDVLITPDTAILHLADLLKVPTLQVALGASPAYKQCTTRPGNLVLAPVLDCFPCSAKTDCHNEDYLKCHRSIKGQDIFHALELMSEHTELHKPTLSENVTIYEVQRDETGIYLRPFLGNMNVYRELSNFASRIYSQKLMLGVNNKELIDFIATRFHTTEVTEWIKYQNESITAVTKNVLRCLRSLRSAAKSPDNGKAFIESLERLLLHCNEKSLVGIPCLVFRGRVETMESTSLKQNIVEMEKNLFNLKNEIHLLMNILAEIYEKKFSKKFHRESAQAQS